MTGLLGPHSEMLPEAPLPTPLLYDLRIYRREGIPRFHGFHQSFVTLYNRELFGAPRFAV